jgi:hypothetical protein
MPSDYLIYPGTRLPYLLCEASDFDAILSEIILKFHRFLERLQFCL